MKCPPNTVCLDQKSLLIIFIISILMIYYLINYFNNQKDHISYLNSDLSKQNRLNIEFENKLLQNEKKIDELEKNRKINQEIPIINQNIDRIINPLEPPIRSPSNSSSYSINLNEFGLPINIPSRGWNPDYQQIGILVHKKNGKILPLFGRQVYNGSSKWTYYTLSDQYNSVKLPISYKNKDCQDEFGCDEIFDGDMVKIPTLNKNFKVNLYKFDKPRYIPYI